MTERQSKLLALARNYGFITVENVFKLLRELIEQAEIIYKRGGAAKREAVLQVLRILVGELPDDDANKAQLLEMLNGVIPEAIDLAVTVANSGAFKSCWRRLSRCCRKRACCSC